jgi:hypothetical protein
MRPPKYRELVREDHAPPRTERSTAPDGWAKPFEHATAPMNAAMRAAQPWVQAAEAVVDWYSAMFRLALGLGRVNSGRERGSSVTAAPAPVEQAEAASTIGPPQSPPRIEQAEASPDGRQSPVAPAVRLRPKRKSPSMAKSRSRSSKASRVRRSRRAA